jgi:hypothetical protein
MPSKFDICSRALIEIGEETIDSFNTIGPAQICGTIYPDYIRYLLSIYPWNFTLKKTQLARLTTNPINEWQYAYQLPSDLLILNAVYNSDDTYINPINSFERFEDKIFTNEEKIYIDYQYQINEESFPAYFIEFAIMALASKLAMPITQDKQLEQLKATIAFGGLSDNKNGGEFGTAKKLDSMQNSSSRIRADSLLIARFS